MKSRPILRVIPLAARCAHSLSQPSGFNSPKENGTQEEETGAKEADFDEELEDFGREEEEFDTKEEDDEAEEDKIGTLEVRFAASGMEKSPAASEKIMQREK